MSRRSVARGAVIVAAAYIVSNLAGFVARSIINARFGTGDAQDAFRAAFIIPDLLFNLLAGGALASAFIPTYVAQLSLDQRPQAWRLAWIIALIVFIGLSVLAVVAAVLAPWLIAGIVAPKFSGPQVGLTAALMRIMLVSTVIFGVSGLLMGVLQSHDSFLAPAIAPSLYQLGIILGATALAPFGIAGLAVGVVLGAVLHLAIQIPALVRIMAKDRITAASLLSARSGQVASPAFASLWPHVQQILTRMPPRVLGLSAVQINNVVNTSLASATAGAVSAVNNAFAIMILPLAVIAQAIGTALFPAISAHAARGERAEFAQVCMRALGVILALSLPASLGLVLLGRPVIQILFQRGAFDAHSTEWVAWTLGWFGVGLTGHAILELVTRAFYALQDSVRPALLAVASMILNVMLSLILTRVFAALGWLPFSALALANSIATVLESVALLALLWRRTPELGASTLFRSLAKSAGATAVMGGVIVAWQALAGQGILASLAACIIGALTYLASMLALRSDEAQFVLKWLRRVPRAAPRQRSALS